MAFRDPYERNQIDHAMAEVSLAKRRRHRLTRSNDRRALREADQYRLAMQELKQAMRGEQA